MTIEIAKDILKGLETVKRSRAFGFLIVMDFLLSSSVYVLENGFSLNYFGMLLPGEKPHAELPMGVAASVLGMYVLILLVSLYIQIAAIKLTYDSTAEKGSLNEALRTAYRRFPQAFLAIFLMDILLAASVGIMFLGYLNLALMCFFPLIGLVLLIFFAVKLIFCLFPVVLSEKNAIGGLSESWEITRGQFMDVLVLIIALGIIEALGSIGSLIPMGYAVIAAPLIFFGSFTKIWAIASLTFAYLEIKEDERRAAQRAIGAPPSEPAPTAPSALIIGFKDSEIERMRLEGIPVHPISGNGRYVRILDILKYPENYEGDPSWKEERFVILHAFLPADLPPLMERIRWISAGPVIFASTTETSIQWSLDHLLNELSEEDRFFKGKTPEKQREG